MDCLEILEDFGEEGVIMDIPLHRLRYAPDVHQNEGDLLLGCHFGKARVKMESADVIDDLCSRLKGFSGHGRFVGVD